MNEFEISPDDPRLTAYALGELEGDERAAVEAALRRSSDLRAAMEEIRATTLRIESALAAEAAEAELIDPPIPMPMAALAAARDHAESQEDDGRRHGRGAAAQRIPFPLPLTLAGGLAAACFAVILMQRAAITPPDMPETPPPVARIANPAAETAPTEIATAVPTVAFEEAVVPPPAAASAEAVALARTEPPAAVGLPLLEQVRNEAPEPTVQAPAAPHVVRLDPLPMPSGPVITSLGLSSLPVGLPPTAREPQLLLTHSAEEPAAHSQAMLQLQNEELRNARLRAAGSPAELARLTEKALRGSRGAGSGEAPGGRFLDIFQRKNRGTTGTGSPSGAP